MYCAVNRPPYEPIRNGRYFDATTDLDELVASSDSTGGTMRCILKRLYAETKRSNTEYQIIYIHHPTPHDYRTKFKITIQLTRYVGDRLTDFAFTLNQDYPFQAPLQMTVNGVAVSHEKYAALEALGRRPGVSPPNDSAYSGGIAPQPTPGTATPSAIGRATGRATGLCDEVKRELGRSCPRCLFCKLYGSGTWSPSKFLGTLVDEYLAVRADVVGAICKGVGREKLMAYRVELPEVIVDEILGWVG
jgi:hypothetical protein